MLIQIQREALSPATFGTMQVDGEFFGYTLELPWKDNEPKVSCIPAGLYGIAITWSNRWKRPMMEIVKVPGRSGIRIHNANFASQLLGCVAVARRRHNEEHISQGIAQILMERVRAVIAKGESVTLEIHDPRGVA